MLSYRLEKEEKRQKKARLRARKAKKRALMQTRQMGAQLPTTTNGISSKSQARFQWKQVPWFIYSNGIWAQGQADNSTTMPTKEKSLDELVVVTWNVLFDLFDRDENSCLPGTPTERWTDLCQILQDSNADVVSLQEVTPRFIQLVTSMEWVQKDYATSASTTDSGMTSVEPHGLCLLWRRSTVQPHKIGLFTCLDVGRNRSMVATLSSNNGLSVFSVAAVHLPADKSTETKSASPTKSEPQSRALARKRELSAILGQLERTCTSVLKDSKSSNIVSWTPILAGDFNSEDSDLMCKYFSPSNGTHATFLDVWSVGEVNASGFTFDPVVNARAKQSTQLVGSTSRPRRIDRIFIGQLVARGQAPSVRRELCPVSASLLGTDNPSPPSDHFGVRATLQFQSTASAFLSRPSLWIRKAAPSPHYMLALALENTRLEAIKRKHDPESSLPMLHLTLLHGFVEADLGCMDLARQRVDEALAAANRAVRPPRHFAFLPSMDILDVFEHRESATIAVCPDLKKDSGKWLTTLYDKLRENFPLCDEQEKHSPNRWTPHGMLFLA